MKFTYRPENPACKLLRKEAPATERALHSQVPFLDGGLGIVDAEKARLGLERELIASKLEEEREVSQEKLKKFHSRASIDKHEHPTDHANDSKGSQASLLTQALAFRILECGNHDNADKVNKTNAIGASCNSASAGRKVTKDGYSLGEIDSCMSELQKLILDLMEKTSKLQITLEKHFEEQDLEKACQTEWRLIAMLLDRLFFCIFSLISTIVFIAYMNPNMEYESYDYS